MPQPNKVISSQLAITENTVKKSLQRIFDKLGLSNRVELALYTIAHPESSPEMSVHARPLSMNPA